MAYHDGEYPDYHTENEKVNLISSGKTGGKSNDYDPELGSVGEPGAFAGGLDGLNGLDGAIDARLRFVRYVYAILCGQLLVTMGFVIACTTSEGVKAFVRTNMAVMWTSIGLSIVILLVLICSESCRKSFPNNFVLLFAFTACESYMLGAVSSLYTTSSVLQALIITAAVTFGLTLYTFRSKRDFSRLGSGLFAALMVFLVAGLLRFMFPYSAVVETVYAAIGALIFCGFIVYDTSIILTKLGTDEYILGAITLYLDIINLFLMILQLFGRRD